MKTLNFFAAVIVVLFSLVLTSCSNDENMPQMRTELLSIDEGNMSEGGSWSQATFCNPLISFTRCYYVVVSEDAKTYEFYLETTSGEFLVARIFPDIETGSPLVAYFVLDKAPSNAVTDHSLYDYEVDIDWTTSASINLDYNGQKVKAIISVVKE